MEKVGGMWGMHREKNSQSKGGAAGSGRIMRQPIYNDNSGGSV